MVVEPKSLHQSTKQENPTQCVNHLTRLRRANRAFPVHTSTASHSSSDNGRLQNRLGRSCTVSNRKNWVFDGDNDDEVCNTIDDEEDAEDEDDDEDELDGLLGPEPDTPVVHGR